MSELSPRLIVVAGPNSSGKTSITEQLLMHEWMGGCVYVNPDLIARDEFGDWSSEEPVLAAARRAEEIREACLRERRSLAFETVLSAPDKLDFLRRGRAAGFFIRLFFIGTGDPSINAKRVAMRVMEGGHDVPITKLVRAGSGNAMVRSMIGRERSSGHVPRGTFKPRPVFNPR